MTDKFFKELHRRKVDSLVEVKRAAEERKRVDEAYGVAVMNAHLLGISNTKIAKEVGVTETAIRLFIKRRKEKEES